MISVAINGLHFINNKKLKEEYKKVFAKIFKSEKKKKEEMKKKEQEQILNELIKQYQKTRDEKVFNKIYDRYKDFIKSKSIKNTININYMSELNLALYNAVLTFDVDNKTNASFTTYFMKCAENQVRMVNNSFNAQKRKANKNTISMQTKNQYLDTETTLEDIIEDSHSKETFNNVDFKVALKTLLKKLKLDDQKAIQLIIQGFTLKEIGQMLGNITASAVCSKLKRLKNKKIIQPELQSLLGMI